jgi:hypothetical protein
LVFLGDLGVTAGNGGDGKLDITGVDATHHNRILMKIEDLFFFGFEIEDK